MTALTIQLQVLECVCALFKQNSQWSFVDSGLSHEWVLACYKTVRQL